MESERAQPQGSPYSADSFNYVTIVPLGQIVRSIFITTLYFT